METASADSMPEGVERQGIGTPATRAATIEKLVQKGFLERKGDKKTKVLLPTDKGKALITVMPEEIQSADMTADWETVSGGSSFFVCRRSVVSSLGRRRFVFE